MSNAFVLLGAYIEVSSETELMMFYFVFFFQAGNTPLHYAASSGLYQCVQVCVTVATCQQSLSFPIAC